MDIEQITRTYIRIRDAMHDRRRAWEEEEQAFKKQLSTLEAAMLQHLHDTRAESVRTAAGTIYRTEEVTPSGSDWVAFYKWIAENDTFEALEKRIKRSFIRDYMDRHDGALPPGVSVYREYVARVRRA